MISAMDLFQTSDEKDFFNNLKEKVDDLRSRGIDYITLIYENSIDDCNLYITYMIEDIEHTIDIAKGINPFYAKQLTIYISHDWAIPIKSSDQLIC